MTIFILAVTAAVPILLSAGLFLLDRRTRFGKLHYIKKQIIYGLLFGALAVCGTEFGIDTGGAIINVRDAAPLCAGLFFGAPSGVIAGVIGGVERYLAVFWGAGEYTQLACSIATVFAGCFGAALRKFLFDNKRAPWYHAMTIAAVTEILHMLLIFLTNMHDVSTAFSFVRTCALTMILLNTASVTGAALVLYFLESDQRQDRHGPLQLSQKFSIWLMFSVVAAFLAATTLSFVLQTQMSENNANELLRLNIDDVKEDINDASDKNLLTITRSVADEVESLTNVDTQTLDTLRKKYDIAEINIIDKWGVIRTSTNPDFIFYNMNGGSQSSEFLQLLDGTTTEFVQGYGPTSSDSSVLRKYGAVTLKDGGFVQVAYDAKRFQKDIDGQVIGITRNRHVGEGGFILIANESGEIVSDRNQNEGTSLETAGIQIKENAIQQEQRFEAEVYGEKSYCMYVKSEGYYIISVLPRQEAVFSRDVSSYITLFMEIVVFGLLFMLVFLLIKHLILDNLRKVNHSLSEITNGNLDIVVDVRSNQEFAKLSDDINATVTTLKHYIEAEAARIDKELEFAKSIQHSALPSVFPPYPNRTEFDIYATMDTAKEVGGDFYDFYLLDQDHLAFLIADVSGKGIPAALFMMTAKTLIKSLAEAGNAVNDVFTLANEKLCENNEAGMFVTAWMGILDLKTGLVEFANAGHNPPLMRKKGGEFTYLKSRAGFVLAGMEGIHYRKNELQLEPGDEIYLYTDGVTEATDLNEAL
ncbi:MAG: SpoIIE family protein phosphatase [Oscillospiraceae bacterium]|nr:SpoIIE family protein phosphatase [Oscillospiraceae bacterium]